MEKCLFAYTFYFMHYICDFCPNHPKPQGLKAVKLYPCSQLVQVGWLVALGPEELGPGWLHLCVQWPVLLWMGDEAAGAGLWHASLPGSMHFTAMMGALGVRGQTPVHKHFLS